MEPNCCKTIICSLLLITLAFGLVNGFEFDEGDFTPCSEGKFGRLIALRTNSCDTFPQACTVYTGNTYNFEMEFETGSASTDLVSHVTGVIGIEVPWPDGPQGPSCHLITDGSCPYEQGQRLIFRASIFVNPIYPQVPVTGRWRLRDHLNQNHICLNIPLQIINGGGTTTTVDPPQETGPTTTSGPTTSGPTTTTGSTTTAGPTTSGPSTTTGTTTTTRATSPRPEETTKNGATNIFSSSILITLITLLTTSLLAK